MEGILSRVVREDSEDVLFEWRLKKVRASAAWSLGTAYWADKGPRGEWLAADVDIYYE